MSDSNFVYLNRENRWAGFHSYGLTRSHDGQLSLRPLPLVKEELPSELALLPAPDGPAGVTAAPDGTLFYTFPLRNELWRRHPCEPGPSLIPCLSEDNGGEGSQLHKPRGVLVHPTRQALIVVDSGNDRLVLFDPHTLQLIDEWGRTGSEPGNFSVPWTVAGDQQGNVYVTDVGNTRVQKLNLNGAVIQKFGDNVQSLQTQLALQRPIDVAVLSNERGVEVYLLYEKSAEDGAHGVVVVVDKDGHQKREFELTTERPEQTVNPLPLHTPMGLAVTAESFYVGANEPGGGRVYQYQLDGTFDGSIHGYAGPVAGVRVSHRHTLLLHPGGNYAPIECPLHGAFREYGFVWGGPFSTRNARPRQWHLLAAEFERASTSAHFQLFVYIAASTQSPSTWNTAPAFEPPWKKQGCKEFGQYLETVLQADTHHLLDAPTNPVRHRDQWVCLTPDTAHALLPGEAGDHVWIGIELISDGTASSTVGQGRIDFDHEPYLRHLPEIYKKEYRSKQFLARFLSTYESLYRDVEDRIAHLRDFFDPMAVSADLLPWLAGWLALDMNPEWAEHEQRQAIAQAFERYAWRGTTRGLRQAIRQYTGVEATIEEPLLNAAWWALPRAESDRSDEIPTSILGVTSMLIPAEAQGAVVGSTAVLDHSHLITAEEFGVPLFDDVAHQFTVQIYQGQVQDERKREAVQAIIEREKPAHTAYHLCIIRPIMRIGFQSRLGIDTVVAGPAVPSRLGGTSVAQQEFVLGGGLPGEIGVRSQIGATTYLNDGTTDQEH